MLQKEPLRSKWLSVIPLHQRAKQSKTVLVCSLHFCDEDYETNRNLVDACNVLLQAKLCPCVVPSIFPKSENQLDTRPVLRVSDDSQLLLDDDAVRSTFAPLDKGSCKSAYLYDIHA
ncbi:hypothetical protein HPB51_022678 [Rhipicephalus microplus]|uniref:THAP-type domain-containing protein n=1 Tax=Rhipicephalus microplus TaxID=6941 RepID=A0A9J6EPB9_RHIMP|nr:hypothetical protein HPB51_022678 [Rhipicephalus microplus]